MILEKLAIVIVFVETNKMVDRFAPTDLHLVCDRLHTKLFLILNVRVILLAWEINCFFLILSFWKRYQLAMQLTGLNSVVTGSIVTLFFQP